MRRMKTWRTTGLSCPLGELLQGLLDFELCPWYSRYAACDRMLTLTGRWQKFCSIATGCQMPS